MTAPTRPISGTRAMREPVVGAATGSEPAITHPVMPARRTVLAGLAVSPLSYATAGAASMADRLAQTSHDPAGPVVVFDVNETLLDLGVLAPVFVRIFGTADMLRVWFDQVILYSEALTLSDDYADSGTVAVAVLKMLAEARQRSVSAADIDALKQLSAAMPTYADTPDALARLREAGFRLVTLSNNPTGGVDRQLTRAGIRDFFAGLHSIDDDVRRYKPARESYLALSTALGVAPSDLWLVSCHAFDTLGAAAAGYRTALVLRPANAPIALGKAPDVVAGDLTAVADRLIAMSGPRHRE